MLDFARQMYDVFIAHRLITVPAFLAVWTVMIVTTLRGERKS